MGKFDVYIHDIALGVGGWRLNTFAGFTEKAISVPVLGRDGFFNFFEVRIDCSRFTIELKEKAKLQPLGP